MPVDIRPAKTGPEGSFNLPLKADTRPRKAELERGELKYWKTDVTCMSNPLSTFRERLLGNICQYDFALYIVLVLEIMLLLLSILSYLFADLNRETEMILILDFVLLGVAFSITTGLIFLCRRFQLSSA